MVQPHLPPQIVSAILKLLWNEGRYGTRDKRALYACCLVSKSFLPLARAELYRDLTFTICDPRRQDKIQTFTEKTLRHYIDYTSYRLRETLLYRPELGVHVEEVWITNSLIMLQHHFSDRICAQLLDELRGRCPGLRAIRFEASEEGQSDEALARFGSQLRSLAYHEGSVPTPEWFKMLCALPALQHLQGLCAYSPNLQVPDDQAPRPTFQLVSLSAYSNAELEQGLLFFILHNSHASLTSLDIPSKCAQGTAWDFSPFVALQSLELQLGRGQAVDQGSEREKGVCYTINTCRALLSLRLTTYEDAPKVWTVDAEKPFLALLPPTLQSLHIGSVQAANHYLQEALADSAVLPSLRTLVLGDSTQVDDSWEDDELTHWTSGPREKNIKESIEKLCEARGVELEWEEWREGERVV